MSVKTLLRLVKLFKWLVNTGGVVLVSLNKNMVAKKVNNNSIKTASKGVE